MAYRLPPLPYNYSALEPTIDTQTMQFHHDKHHAAYVTNANAALEKHPDLEKKFPTAEDLLRNINQVPEDVRTALRNNAGGHANHSMFWNIMQPKGGGPATGPVSDAIKQAFGSFDQFVEQFNAAGTKVFGSGWVWLVRGADRKLQIITTPNQDSPFMQGLYPVMGNDVWEHAYYLNYQNRRADYLKAWWNVVNWTEINRRFEGITYSDDSLRKAQSLADRLLDGFGTNRRYKPERIEIFIADVEFSLQRFDSFVRHSWPKEMDLPCIVDQDGPVPLDVIALQSTVFTDFGKPLTDHDDIAVFARNLKLEYVKTPRRDIQDLLRTRLARFLVSRFGQLGRVHEPVMKSAGAAAASYGGFSGRPTGYLPFQVQTHESALRIHFTPSYLIDWSNVFGSPTTPVDGWLRPGRYKFAGMRTDGKILVDNANFDLPPLSSAALTI